MKEVNNKNEANGNKSWQQTNDLLYKASQLEGQCLLLRISPIKLNYLRYVLYIMSCIILIGIPRLLIYWFPSLERIFYYDYCWMDMSTHFCIVNYDQELSICLKQEGEIYRNQRQFQKCYYFTNRYLQYLITNGVVQAHNFDSRTRIKRLMSATHEERRLIGLNDEEVKHLRQSFGVGTMVIEQPSVCQLLIKEIFRPLYMFLLFSVCLWIYQVYYYYSGMLFFTEAMAIIINLYQMVQLNKKIFEMAYYEVMINCLRNGQVKQVSSLDLVPGDIVFLKDPIKIPFEGIILEGSALINQCALTGESVPVVKKADLYEKYINLSQKIDKFTQVFEGTTIIQVNCKKKMIQFQNTRQNYGIPVCITKTNFSTTKGQLIRIILFPKEQENIFQRQSAKFLFFLFGVSIITYLGILKVLVDIVDPIDIFTKFLDLITITVPPALPVSMAIGIIYAIQKLKDKSIFCIEQSKVIVGGMVNLCCFDKTGTLTEDYMDFQCIIPVKNCSFEPALRKTIKNKIDQSSILNECPYLLRIFTNMACNHSIIKIEQTKQLIGDPMQIKLFEFGCFTLNQNIMDPNIIFSFASKHNHEGDIYYRFEFDSDLQRMSVIAKNHNEEQFYVYCKGSPQSMMNVMKKQTIPIDYLQVLKQYTSNGLRVLAVAHKQLKKHMFHLNQQQNNNLHAKTTVNRNQIEDELVFDGFEVFENKLKPQSKQAVQQLKQAEIGVVMITGDNALTGSNIGYKCGIANISKKMLICDYYQQKKQLIEEEFIYHDHEEKKQTQIKDIQLDKHYKKEQDYKNDHSGINLTQENLTNHYYSNKTNAFKTIEQEMFVSADIIPEEIISKKIQEINQDINHDANIFMKNVIAKAIKTHSQLCVTGAAFNMLFEGKIQEISLIKRQFLSHCCVFARTKPNDKAKIVMVFQHLGNTVSMCGDGANDCGALKQADIGLSLSPAEASISAPFTSQVTNISSMVQLIKQCRAGLATNFSLFNIMATYSLIQYSTTCICQIYYSYSTDFQYLYWDVVCNFFFIIVIGYTKTADKLSIEKPSGSLFSFTNLFQVLVVFAIQIVGQICMILAYSGMFADETGYYEMGSFEINKALYIESGAFVIDTPQANILFFFANFMYLFSLVGFSIGKPWKQSFYTNIPFMIILICSITYSIVIIIVPESRIPMFQVSHIDDINLRGFVLGIGLLFGVVILVLQKCVLEPFSTFLRNKYPEKKWL